ncbi:MAG: exodeoxyribonuclease VII large subunit [Sphingobacterium sp.]
MPEQVANKTVFTLLEVAKSIQKTIAERYRSSYWIKAEMNKLNHYTHSGHCFPELVEKRDGKVLAEMRSILWKGDYQRINKQFMEILGEPLSEGITILFQANITYDPLYGLSLRIVDIDPAFVLGELEKEKRASIGALKREGIFQANKGLAFPLVPKRLAIISVETSKGLSDFYKIVQKNPWGYRLETTLYPAILQGERSIEAILGQLQIIASRLAQYDAVAIIRGGGAEVGLTSFNHYRLAKAVALFPLPVLTGIGHSTNETVTEMVAHINAITPSELADFVLQKFHAFSLLTDQAEEQLVRSARGLFAEHHDQLERQTSKISWSAKTLLLQQHAELRAQKGRLDQAARTTIKREKTHLKHLERILAVADPVHLLRRGFSIVRVAGKSVHRLEQVPLNTELEIQLEDGIVRSKVILKTE